jgi:hypothetical protein
MTPLYADVAVPPLELPAMMTTQAVSLSVAG